MKVEDVNKYLKPASVLLMGDFMLDAYTFGKAQRLSPEAPVPLLFVERENFKPGGGGNAILNLLSLGMKVYAVGRIGKDFPGTTFHEMIQEKDLDASGIFVDDEFQTPLKRRMIADYQQLLRVDYESFRPLTLDLEERVINHVSSLLDKISVIAISDYGKGFFTPSLLRRTIEIAAKASIPIIIDPKGHDFSKYRGATMIKPNFAEAILASRMPSETPLNIVAQHLFEITASEMIMVTRAKEGISLFWKEGESAHFPAAEKDVRDVTGAGDTVLAVVTAGMANRVDLRKIAPIANIAASIAIERLGCARITKDEILQRLN